ncbi:alpha/beta hydrolase [uncultured Tateyamaria sp.]|uniref:alpha/beta hydrolase n=1 Tax=uncultured Tateyamaria sp. TaxID=455651 RepID=UPI0026267390|nr:alpha/beta hydrolase [uncultured Tateyamaria sp.]
MIPFKRLLAFITVLTLAACSAERVLAPTPNVFLDGAYPQGDVPAAFQAVQSPIFYVTDRAAVSTAPSVTYGAGRSNAMVFGASTVSFGQGEDWVQLTTASGATKRASKLPLSIVQTREILRFDATPTPFRVANGRPVPVPAALASYNRKRAAFQAEVRKQMRLADRQEVVIFVHGFNNSFEDAVFSLADIWHFSGRSGVPIAYSWPAGAGGLFGYFTDRESGEFTVFHLKEFLRQLAEIPELRKIHIVAHSRGTDVTTTALREMIIAVRNQGRNPKKVLKIANLILAAPDLDFSVVRQRLIAEGFGASIGQITVYMNRGDTALGLAQRLMSGERFGRLSAGDVGLEERAIFDEVKTVNFVNVEGVSGLTGHAYYRTNRNVLSDIAVLIRESPPPGSAARPLVRIQGNFWTMPERYPL